MIIPSFLASHMYHYAMVIAFRSAISFNPNLDLLKMLGNSKKILSEMVVKKW